jgi:hypothetical protein
MKSILLASLMAFIAILIFWLFTYLTKVDIDFKDFILTAIFIYVLKLDIELDK